MELSATRVNVDLETGTVILVGVDASEIVSEIGTENLLNAMEYSDVFDYVMECEKDKRDADE